MSPLYIDKTMFINDFMVGLWEKMNFEPYSNNEIYEKILEQFKSSLSKAELLDRLALVNPRLKRQRLDSNIELEKMRFEIELEKTRFENAIKVELFSDMFSKTKSIRCLITDYNYAIDELTQAGILS